MVAVRNLSPEHLIFGVVLLTEMKNGGIGDAGRLFLYLNLVSSFADKARLLAGLYKGEPPWD